MVTQETAARIWQCYREIEMAEGLIKDIQESAEYHREDPRAGTIKDAFGRHKNLQLGVPSGHQCHKLYDVSPKLAESVIRAHIENKRAELAEANEQAGIELTGG